jgi:ABC-type nitrate/sulfonate/bicarbonate transport system permease component
MSVALTLRNRNQSWWKWGLRGLFVLLFIVAWEIIGRLWGGILLAPFSRSIIALPGLVVRGDLIPALIVSNQSLLLGFGLSVGVGVPLGLLMGRAKRFERYIDLYLSVLLVTPVAAIIPLVIIFLGLGLAARICLVFIFAFVVITVNTRTGMREIDPALVEMAVSFGANESQLWRKILLPGSLPAMMAGIRLGLGRAITGMVVSELLLVAVGLGRLMLNYMGRFESDRLFAVILAIIIESVLLMDIAKRIEARLIKWRATAGEE